MAYLSGDITEHFTWEEACITQVRDLDNSIPLELLRNVKFTAQRMEAVRTLLLNNGIIINSWYRSPGVNERVGGSRTSQHMEGIAVDFISPKYGDPLTICQKIIKYADLINFDQLIYEHSWVHVSFIPIPDAVGRRQVLTLLNGGKYAQGLTRKDGVRL